MNRKNIYRLIFLLSVVLNIGFVAAFGFRTLGFSAPQQPFERVTLSAEEKAKVAEADKLLSRSHNQCRMQGRLMTNTLLQDALSGEGLTPEESARFVQERADLERRRAIALVQHLQNLRRELGDVRFRQLLEAVRDYQGEQQRRGRHRHGRDCPQCDVGPGQKK